VARAVITTLGIRRAVVVHTVFPQFDIRLPWRQYHNVVDESAKPRRGSCCSHNPGHSSCRRGSYRFLVVQDPATALCLANSPSAFPGGDPRCGQSRG
jgi:hypothetical protein